MLKVIAGNPGHRPLNKKEPQVRNALKDAPSWFDGEHKRVWDYAIKEAPAGLLRSLDESALSAWVCAYVLHRRAVEELRCSTLLTESIMGSVVATPLVAIQVRSAQLMLKAAEQLGFTPSSRSRVTVDPGDDSDDEKTGNPFGHFANKGR
jgi:P27 family predicted phage terminase small subunit